MLIFYEIRKAAFRYIFIFHLAFTNRYLSGIQKMPGSILHTYHKISSPINILGNPLAQAFFPNPGNLLSDHTGAGFIFFHKLWRIQSPVKFKEFYYDFGNYLISGNLPWK